MAKALTALREGRMGLNAVARLYSISKPTLRRHLLNLNKYANGSTLKRGRGTCLPHDFETELVEHVVRLEKMLFGITRKDLMKLAYELSERNGLQHVFFDDELQLISSITPPPPMCPTSSPSLVSHPATQGTGSAYSATASVGDHSAAASTLSANDATVTGQFMFCTNV